LWLTIQITYITNTTNYEELTFRSTLSGTSVGDFILKSSFELIPRPQSFLFHGMWKFSCIGNFQNI